MKHFLIKQNHFNNSSFNLDIDYPYSQISAQGWHSPTYQWTLVTTLHSVTLWDTTQPRMRPGQNTGRCVVVLVCQLLCIVLWYAGSVVTTVCEDSSYSVSHWHLSYCSYLSLYIAHIITCCSHLPRTRLFSYLTLRLYNQQVLLNKYLYLEYASYYL